MDFLYAILLFALIALIFNRGIGGAIRYILGILIILVGLMILKQLIIFLPIIILFFILKNKFSDTPKRRTYFYQGGNAQDFEEFFRQAGFGGTYGQGGSYQQGGYSYGQGNSGGFSYAEDLTKYYQILGVSKSASKDEIKKAYRNLVKQHHPDRFATASDSEKKIHEDKLKEINEAYEKIMKD